MADLQLEIEGIVREVLRRLQAVQGAATNPAPRAAANPKSTPAKPATKARAAVKRERATDKAKPVPDKPVTKARRVAKPRTTAARK